MADSALYVYCLLRAAEPPDTSAAPPGVAGAGPTRALRLADRLWLVAADAPLERYGEEAIAAGLEDLEWVSARALAHEQTIAHFLDAGDLLPLKLFTIFLDAERASARLLADLEGLHAGLDRVSGRREWGVRVLLDEAQAAEAVERESLAEGGADEGGAGKAFLLRKKVRRDARRLAREAGDAASEALLTELGRHSAEHLRRPAEGTTLLDAVFLVSTEATAEFQAALEEARSRLGAKGISLRVTGPWPAYHFLAAPR